MNDNRAVVEWRELLEYLISTTVDVVEVEVHTSTVTDAARPAERWAGLRLLISHACADASFARQKG
jgi:hypothetical protein